MAPDWKDDINTWKSKPQAARPKWKGDSGSAKGNASPEASGKSFKGQAKLGGTVSPAKGVRGQPKVGGVTVSPSKNFRSQPKIQGATERVGKSFKGQPKIHSGASAPDSGKRDRTPGGTKVDAGVHHTYRQVISKH